MDQKNNKLFNENLFEFSLNKRTVRETVSFNAKSISEDLKDYSQLVIWKPEQRDGKLANVPYMVQGLTDIKDPGTWTEYEKETTLLVEDTGTYLGLGLVIDENEPCILFDLKENIVLDNYPENSRIDKCVHLIQIGL
jgi:primase-polymerase (primpol)-like protein